MKRVLASLAFLCFCLSFLAHFGAYFGFNAGEAFPAIWSLHFLAILFGFLAFRKRNRAQSWDSFLQDVPTWGRTLLKVFFVYAALNFSLFFAGEVGRGTPQRLNGTYAIHRIDEGRRVFAMLSEADENLERVELSGIPVLRETEDGISVFKELTEAEYYQRTIPTMRGFTGHWMIFLLLASLYLWFQKPENSIHKPETSVSG